MGFKSLDVICARRQPLIYVSPPFCEVDFSSTGEPVIVLSPFRRRRGPTGFRFDIINGRIRFRWDTTDGAICYSLYRREGGEYILVAECFPCGDSGIENTCEFVCETCGPGNYVITVITVDGESEVSEEVAVGGFAAECTDDAGQPVPTGTDAFDIDGEVEYDIMTINQAEFVPWPSDPNWVTQEWPDDYPPGHYDVRYVTGFFDQGPSGPNVCGSANLWGNWDDNYNQDTQPTVGPWVTKNIYETTPPGNEVIAGGISQCGLSYSDVESQHQAFWNGSTPHRFKFQERHENDGGKLLAAWDSASNGSFDTVVGFDYKLQLIQIDGQIRQPLKLRVQGWEFMKGMFSPAMQAWDGVFEERTDYTSDTLVYTSPGFGQVFYVGTGFVGSPNLAGYRVEIGGGGGEWRGNKVIDETAEGQYRRTTDSPNIPACIVLEKVPAETP